MTTTITSNHNDLKSSIDAVKELSEAAIKKATDNETQINELSEEIKEISLTNNENNALTIAKISELAEELDDQINRNLRTTLIFRGIATNPTEKSWDDTTNILIDNITNHCPDLDGDTVYNAIERAHRGRPNTDKTKPPNIYVKFNSWRDSERIKNTIIKKNKGKGNKYLQVSPMYSKSVTKRNNEALKHRKELIVNHPDKDFIVVYPAKILSRKKNSRDKYDAVIEF